MLAACRYVAARFALMHPTRASKLVMWSSGGVLGWCRGYSAWCAYFFNLSPIQRTLRLCGSAAVRALYPLLDAVGTWGRPGGMALYYWIQVSPSATTGLPPSVAPCTRRSPWTLQRAHTADKVVQRIRSATPVSC